MPEKKTKTQRYEELIKALQEGEMGMAKFLWNFLEKIEGTASESSEKALEYQRRIDKFIDAFKDRKDGKTPTKEELVALMKPLIPSPIPGKPGKNGDTPSTKKILELIESVIPDPIPGPPGKPGKPGKDGKRGKTPNHEWNGTLIRFQKPDGTWGEFVNLQGPPGQNAAGAGFGGSGKTGALERVRGANAFEMQGVSQIYFGNNLTVERLGDNGIRVDGQAGGGSSLSVEEPDGTVDDVNLEFTVENEPLYIVVNGAQYFVGTGAYQSYDAGVITLAYPVGTGGFIRSVYQVTS